MKSIINGPTVPHITVAGQAATATTLAVPTRIVNKEPSQFNEQDKAAVEIDKQALTYLTMAIPNDIYNRVDNRDSAKEI